MENFALVKCHLDVKYFSSDIQILKKTFIYFDDKFQHISALWPWLNAFAYCLSPLSINQSTNHFLFKQQEGIFCHPGACGTGRCQEKGSDF